MSLLRLKPIRKCAALAAAVLLLDLTLLTNNSQSCSGGFGEPTVINSKETLLGMPSARFAQEIARIKKPATPFRYIASEDPLREGKLAKADTEDLASYLRAAGQPEQLITKLQEWPAAFRLNILDRLSKHLQQPNTPKPQGPIDGIDPSIPSEFSDYLNGWAAYQFGDQMEEARNYWKKVLDLPADQRQWRGVWAAYMTGRSYQSDPVKAIPWFIKTRELAAAGAHDTLGLAAASYGWQARAELDLKHFDAAIELYLTQHATGDPTAVPSLQLTCVAAVAAGDEALNTMARNENSRAVMTSFIVAMGGPWQEAPKPDRVATWLKAIEAANIANLDNADRLAWSAYEYGHYDLAARWVARADQNSGLTLWVASKLALRDGKIDEAMKLLAKAAELFPTVLGSTESDEDGYVRNINSVERVRGELGALLLARSKYVESLDLLTRNGYWIDAAYIAERVLTVDELKAYVDQTVPQPTTRPSPEDQSNSVRTLLARRLLRLGRWKDARPYFDDTEQKLLDQYIGAIRNGHDRALSATDRGNCFWQAALIARKNGMELLGTALEPDVGIFGGNTDRDYTTENRKKVSYAPLIPSPDERRRLERPPEQLSKRFHYRYVAADHAWAAAALLPDDSADLANVLNTAGGWLKAKDPQSADRFYKALVRRCPNTEIGKKAIAAHWFISTQ